MATNFYTVTLDGATDYLDVQGNTVSWGGNFIKLASFQEFSADDLNADINLNGNDWYIDFFEVFSNVLGAATIDDGPGGTGRAIGTLQLFGVNSVISLDTTWVRTINGFDNASSYDVTLGDAGADFISLFADTNRVETGSGFVHAIVTGGVDTVHVYGGGNSISTGGQDDEIGLFGGFTASVDAGSGNDLFGAVGGSGGRVNLGDGDDMAFVNNGYVELLQTDADNDMVVVDGTDGGGAGRVNLGDGNDTLTVRNGANVDNAEGGNGDDTVTVSSGGRVEFFFAGEGNATVTVEAGSRLDNLFVRGTSTVDAIGDGRIRKITADESTLTYTTGTARTNLIDAWRTDSTITMGDGGAGSVGLFSDQFQSHTFFSSGWVSLLEMGDGQTMNLTLTNEGAGLVSLGDLADTVVIRDNAFVDNLNTREGDDIVSLLNNAGATSINLRDGNDRITVENSFVNALRLGTGDDTVVISGDSFVRFAVRGEDGNDLMIGGNDDDTFDGGNDNDSFLGGKGFNVATGGNGADRFGFSPEDDVFVITDFEQGVDQLILVNFDPAVDFNFLTQGGFVNQDGNDLVIGSGSKGYILENTQLSDWSADDLGFLTI